MHFVGGRVLKLLSFRFIHFFTASTSSEASSPIMDRDPATVFSHAYTPVACKLAKMIADDANNLGGSSSIAALAKAAPALNLTVQQVKLTSYRVQFILKCYV
jgi:hypothetical protein